MRLNRLSARTAATPHGFRSSFRDGAGEMTSHPREVAEAALAHSFGDKVEAACRRGDALAKRAALMTEWAMFIEGLAEDTGNVVALRRPAPSAITA